MSTAVAPVLVLQARKSSRRIPPKVRPVVRVPISFQKMVQRVSARFGSAAATAWTKAVLKYQKQISAAALQSAIASGNAESILAVVDPQKMKRTVGKALEAPLLGSSIAMGTAGTGVLRAHGIAATFSAVHPNVVLYARQQAADLVVDVPKQVKQIIGEVIARGAEGRLTVAEQARAIREVVGLSPNMAQAPAALAKELRAGNVAAATGRRLSAVTKQQIRSAIASGKVTDAFVERMTASYSESLINLRSQAIARTETHRAANFGLTESWRQAKEQGVLPQTTRRMWIVTPDDRLSEEHARIPAMNSAGRELDEPFITPEGLFMFPPIRPNCRCSVGLLFTGGADVIEGPLQRVGGDAPAQPTTVEGLARLSPQELGQLEDVGVLVDPLIVYRRNPFATPAFLDQGETPMGALDAFLSSRLSPREYERLNALLAKPEQLSLKKLPLAPLQTTQPFVTEKALTARVATVGTDPAVVVRVNGQDIIWDGNHRLVADLLRGETKSTVRFLNVDQFTRGKTRLPESTFRAAPRRLAQAPRGVPTAVQDAVNKKLLDLGINPNVASFRNDLGRARVGGGQYSGTVVGEYKKGKIYLHPYQGKQEMVQTTAHEATHLQFEVALKTDKTLKRDILADWEGLRKDDGVTLYSRAHWKRVEYTEEMFPREQWYRMLPVNETLAEIRWMEVIGRKVGAPRYRALLKRVETAYAKGASRKFRPEAGVGAVRSIRADLPEIGSVRAGAQNLSEVWNGVSPAERKLLSKVHVKTNDAASVPAFRRGGGGQVILDKARGAYYPKRRQITLPKVREASTVGHEVGHAIDHALGKRGAFASTAKDFQAAVKTGMARSSLTYQQILKGSYTTEQIAAEVFADMYAVARVGVRVRGGLVGAAEFRAQFPEAWLWMLRKLQAAGIA